MINNNDKKTSQLADPCLAYSAGVPLLITPFTTLHPPCLIKGAVCLVCPSLSFQHSIPPTLQSIGVAFDKLGELTQRYLAGFVVVDFVEDRADVVRGNAAANL